MSLIKVPRIVVMVGVIILPLSWMKKKNPVRGEENEIPVIPRVIHAVVPVQYSFVA